MARVQSTDLIVVGRGGSSYQVPFSDLKLSVTDGNTIAFPDVSQLESQPGTIDERYVMAAGDVMIGALQLPTGDPAGNFDATHKSYVDAADNVLQNNIEILQDAIQVERELRADGDTALTNRLNDEVARAEGAETALDQKIDDLILNSLADVSVGGASNRQVLSWDAAGQQWIAKTVTLTSALDFSGSINLTASDPGGAQAGQLFANNGTGAVHPSFGTSVTDAIPNVTGGELVAYDGSIWVYVGSVGGGLTYASLSSANVAAQANSGGQLSYNSDTGVFTFQRADIDSRVPTDLSTLPVLPTV